MRVSLRAVTDDRDLFALDQSEVRARFLVCRDLDQREIALQQGTLGDVFAEQHVYQFFEAGLETMGAAFVGVRDDGHAGDLLVFGRADGERVDVNVQTARERGDTVQNARFIFDVGN